MFRPHPVAAGALATLTTLAALCLSVSPASADPTEGLVVETVCDDGNTYTTIARASADWNAQLVTDNNSVLHLTWYEVTFEVTAPDGEVSVFGPFIIDKGGNDRTHKNLLNCTFAFDVDLGDGSTSHVSGPLQGWLTPSRG